VSSDFLKREIEAEAKAVTRSRAITIAVATPVLVLSLLGFGYWYSHRERTPNQSTATSIGYPRVEEKANVTSNEPTSTSVPNTQKAQSGTTSSQQKPPQQTPSPSYQYTPTVISKSAFIASGNQMMASYSEIVGLVTFAPSDSDDAKADHIRQAVALDRQAIRNTTALRGQLVSAEISSGPYMDITSLAESGAAAISVGLNSMNYWANDRSRTSDLQSGLGGVTEGSNILLTFSQKLNAL
jgi:hypothetical protein